MLTIYRSNRAEWLAKVLSEQLRICPPKLFENVDIIVNSWPISRWLGEEIANVNGINALVKFPFPGAYLRKITQIFLELDITSNDPWRSNELTWHIIELMPELLKEKEANSLKEWLRVQNSFHNELDTNKWQLAKSIANTLDEYDLYRPQLIYQWWVSAGKKKRFEKENVQEQIIWQPKLLQLLRNKINYQPFSLQVRDVVKKLKNGDIPKNRLPSQINIFGINSLAPIQVELLQSLSCAIEINIFLLTPCKDLWQRHAQKRIEINSNFLNSKEENSMYKSSRLETILGRTGSDFEQLLEGSGEYQLGKSSEEDLFAMPAKIAKNNFVKPTLLEQLQERLVHDENQNKFTKVFSDNSLTFIECPGQKRELEIIRDQIIQWMAKDVSLQPRDILIMTPQIESFAPLVPSIFNYQIGSNIKLPWKITDRTQQEKSGLIKWLIELMNIANTQLTSRNLDLLISRTLIQKQYKLTTDDIDKITNCLQETGFRRGVGSSILSQGEEHSLRWCLERWLLGISIPTEPGIAPGGIAPFTAGITFNELTKWWVLLSRIANNLNELSYSRLCTEWVQTLKEIVRSHFSIEYDLSWEYKQLVSALDEWEQLAGNCILKIEPGVVSEILENFLTKESGRFGHRSGNITISALEPMRAIPHKAIILMGLDGAIFPRKQKRTGFNLLNNSYLLGDPNTSNRDRYVLLEALMSARKYLLITWNSKNSKTGERLEPSAPIQQWLEYLENELEDNDMQGTLRAAPCSPLNEKNFIEDDYNSALSCNKRDLKASLSIRNEAKTKFTGLAFPLKWSNTFHTKDQHISHEQLKDWLVAPQIFWLESKQLSSKEWFRQIYDIESLKLNELKRYQLLAEKFEEKKGLLLKKNNEIKDLGKINWKEEYLGQGIFPPQSAGVLEVEILKNRWESLSKLISDLGPIHKELLYVDNEIRDIYITKEYALVIDVAKSKSSSIMRAWLSHLQLCAFHEAPKETVLISRNDSSLKTNNYHIAYTWNKITRNDSKEIISDIKKLVQKGLEECWPVPPKSGWLFAKASIMNQSNAKEVFKQSWEGLYQREGERKEDGMRICFGESCDSDLFLENEAFNECINTLYHPLLKCLKTR